MRRVFIPIFMAIIFQSPELDVLCFRSIYSIDWLTKNNWFRSNNIYEILGESTLSWIKISHYFVWGIEVGIKIWINFFQLMLITSIQWRGEGGGTQCVYVLRILCITFTCYIYVLRLRATWGENWIKFC